MGPNDVPSREDPAAVPVREIQIPPAEPEAPPAASPPEGSPLRDYLLELEQEFQDQQDEGKV